MDVTFVCVYMYNNYIFYSKPRETKKFVNDGRAPDTTMTLFDLGNIYTLYLCITVVV